MNQTANFLHISPHIRIVFNGLLWIHFSAIAELVSSFFFDGFHFNPDLHDHPQIIGKSGGYVIIGVPSNIQFKFICNLLKVKTKEFWERGRREFNKSNG
jgi:hypothetical protein